MSVNKFSFEPLHAARAAVAEADANLTKAETAAERAAEAEAAASKDDGRMPPEKLLERIEAAERTAKVRQIELRRASAVRATAVAAFYKLLKQAGVPLVAALRAKASEEREKVRETLLAQLGPATRQDGHFLQTLDAAEAVAMPMSAMRRLELTLNFDSNADEPTNALIQNTFAAEEFLSPATV